MNTKTALLPCLLTALVTPLAAQVPDGWIVWGSFQGAAGQNGIFFSHPRDPAVPIVEVGGLPPALAYDPAGQRGAACVAYRRHDGALIAGERAPAGTSVDLHVITLNGNSAQWVQLFSVGTSASVGEIPQCAVLDSRRIVVAATDLQAGGPLAQFQTAQYNWEGVGIVDTVSGAVTAIPIANLNQFPGVINSLALSPDGQTIYIGNWISSASGDVWAVPIAGGTAVQVATLPYGASNLAVDNDGTVLITTLNGPPNLLRYDPATNSTTTVPTTTGPLNAIAIERVTGNYLLATANGGSPVRSLVWMTPAGQETVLISPNRATISAIDVNPNPETFGAATPGTASYDWQLAPNPGGLPLVGNAGFSLTVTAQPPVNTTLGLLLINTARATTPLTIVGLTVHVDPGTSIEQLYAFSGAATTLPLPIPGSTQLRGMVFFVQSLHMDPTNSSFAASPGLQATLL